MKLKLLNETHWFYRCRKIKGFTAILALIFAFSTNIVFSQDPIQTVDFEDGTGYTVEPQEYVIPDPENSALPDYWKRTNGGAEIAPGIAFSGMEGTWFFAGEDLDNLASTYSFTCNSVSVSGYSNSALPVV